MESRIIIMENTLNLTQEQKDIVAVNLKRGDFMKIYAFAGCTKTTTLREYTKAYPDKSFLYLAFNTSVAAEARKAFPSNVKCATTHSVAFNKKGFIYKHKLGYLRPHDVKDQVAGLTYPVAKYIADVIGKFAASSDRDICEKHLVLDSESSVEELSWKKSPETIAFLIKKAKEVWEKMCDTKNLKMPMTHDGYLKLFQLSQPKLDYDVILLDEAHDTSDVVIDIFQSQDCARIAVGDSHQAIYAFRWAENALDKLKGNIEMRLTGSFRFGDSVSEVANTILKNMKKETCAVVGLNKGDKLQKVEESKPYTVIARTNGSLFRLAAQTLKERGNFATFGWVGTREQDNWSPYKHYFFDRIEDVYHLFARNKAGIKDSYIKRFDNFESFLRVIRDKDAPDLELQARTSVVLEYTHEVPDIIRKIITKSIDPSEADIKFVTAHRSKGLEFDQVKLTDDFSDMVISDPDTGKERLADDKDVDPQEMNLIYVAATRAKKVLEINPQIDKLRRFLCQQKKTS